MEKGDSFTIFFQAYAKSRETVNCIDKIHSDGIYVDDQSQIQSLDVDHFSSVANSAHQDPSDLLFRIDSTKVTAD